jgi:hypothetical protein
MRFNWHQNEAVEAGWTRGGFAPPDDFATLAGRGQNVRRDEGYRLPHPEQCNSGINLDAYDAG